MHATLGRAIMNAQKPGYTLLFAPAPPEAPAGHLGGSGTRAALQVAPAL